MFFRTFIFAFLAVGALAEKLELDDKARNSIKTKFTEICVPAEGTSEENAEKLTNSVQTFFDCFNPLLDFDTLKEEINSAKPNGTSDEVVKKYCAKIPEFKTCLHGLIDATSPCVKESAKNQITSAKNITDQILDYICYKDGDRITQFLTENGTECYESKPETGLCINNFQMDINGSLDNILWWTLLERCSKFDQLTTCILKPMETCTTPAPGKLLESLYKNVRAGTACNDALPLPK